MSGLLQILVACHLDPLWDTCINCTLFLMILQSNDLDECFNQEMWDEYLDTYVYAYNTSVHDSTTFSPFEVMFGRKAILPIDINIDEKEPDMMLMNQEEIEPAIAEVIDVMSEQCLKVLESVKQSIQQAQIKQKHYYALVAFVFVCLPKWGLETRLQTTAVFLNVECRLSPIHRISKVIRGVMQTYMYYPNQFWLQKMIHLHAFIRILYPDKFFL